LSRCGILARHGPALAPTCPPGDTRGMDQERENYAEPNQPPPIWGPEGREIVVAALIGLGGTGAILAAVSLWLAWSGHQPR
jgi:hypothetical protein